ncbi:hypothetical protein ACM25P_02710 [Vreelandella alkaliphila]|uniref:hypothetical protein n=1 Tax=Vreelandella alkaliphila TaxID=272774 RepID=UPI0039F5D161
MTSNFYVVIEGDDSSGAYRTPNQNIDWHADDIVSELREAWKNRPYLEKDEQFERSILIKERVLNPPPFLLGRGESLPDRHAILIKEAEACPVAFELARRLAAGWIKAGVKLTPPLSSFAAQYMQSRSAPKNQRDNSERDFIITLWVVVLSHERGIPIESKSSKIGVVDAISVVAEAIHLSYPTIRRIYRKNKTAVNTLPD